MPSHHFIIRRSSVVYVIQASNCVTVNGYYIFHRFKVRKNETGKIIFLPLLLAVPFVLVLCVFVVVVFFLFLNIDTKLNTFCYHN